MMSTMISIAAPAAAVVVVFVVVGGCGGDGFGSSGIAVCFVGHG